MSLCKYYMRGNCRYGDRCKMIHSNSNVPPNVYNQNGPPFRPRVQRPQYNPDYRYVAPSVANRNHTVTNHTTSAKQDSKYSPAFHWVTDGNFTDKVKAFDILIQLQTEARAWLKSSTLWRFTSRSIFPGGRPLDGWIDQSFEEVRWLYRDMVAKNEAHLYKQAYSEYWENTERQLLALSTLKIDTLNILKDRIDECIASDYKPSKTLATDIEMRDVNENITPNFLPQTQSTNYTPDDQLLEDERAAFESATFEVGQIPVHAPSKQFC